MQDLRRSLLREATLCKSEPSPKNAKTLTAVRNNILACVQNVGQRGDLQEIVATEEILLENELEHHANSKSMISSLNTALADLANAQKLIHIVGDKKAYNHIANAYALQRNRPQGIPKDEARQAFNSHAARLGNLDKGRISDQEKEILHARKHNIAHANQLYKQQQARTLGVVLPEKPPPAPDASTQFKALLARHGVTENSPNYNIVMNAFAEVTKAQAEAK